jgi:hypothetical protein
MENVIDSIRAAIASDASPEAKAAGATACRAILTALESTPGQPLATPAIVPLGGSQIASVVSALRGVPPDQLLDLAIQRLRAALPAGVDVPAAQPLKFQLIPTTQLATLAGKPR